MKKKLFTRPVSVTLTDEMFDQIKVITDHGDIGLSEYIRDAVQEKLIRNNQNNEKGGPKNDYGKFTGYGFGN